MTDPFNQQMLPVTEDSVMVEMMELIDRLLQHFPVVAKGRRKISWDDVPTNQFVDALLVQHLGGEPVIELRKLNGERYSYPAVTVENGKRHLQLLVLIAFLMEQPPTASVDMLLRKERGEDQPFDERGVPYLEVQVRVLREDGSQSDECLLRIPRDQISREFVLALGAIERQLLRQRDPSANTP